MSRRRSDRLRLASSGVLLLALMLPTGTAAGTDPASPSPGASGESLPSPIRIDLDPVGSSMPFILGEVGGAIVFGAMTPDGTFLYRTDGTAEGMTRISEDRLFPCLDSDGYCDHWSPEAVVVGGTLFLSSATSTELWATDGTSEGTRLLLKGWVGALTASGDQVFLVGADRKHGFELWRTDGTIKGTRLVRDIRPGRGDGVCVQTGGDWCLDQNVRMAVTDGRLFFAADDGRHGVEPWVSDGTRKGTRRLADIRPGRASGGCAGSDTFDCGDATFITVPSHAYFWGSDARHGTELWITDGSTQGTHLMADLMPGPKGSDPEPWTAGVLESPGRLYFVARSDRGRALWVTDQRKGTRRLMDLDGIGRPHGFTAADGGMYFLIDGKGHRDELWHAAGTPESTIRVVNGPADGEGPPIGDMVVLDGVLYFTTHDLAAEEAIIWRTDGTAAGTVAVARMPSSGEEDESCSYTCGVGPLGLTASGGRLFFTNDDGESGRELWVFTPADVGIPPASPTPSASIQPSGAAVRVGT